MQRLLASLFDTAVVLLGVSTLVFLLLVLVPGDPVDVMLGESAQAADREAMRAALGLDRPLFERWLMFHGDLVRGDLGQSLVRRQPVAQLIGERLTATLQLAAAAFLLVLVTALPLGIVAARYRGRWPDRAWGKASIHRPRRTRQTSPVGRATPDWYPRPDPPT